VPRAERGGRRTAVPPLGLQADTSVPGQVTLTWLPASGATSYKVYRRVDPLIVLVGAPPQWIFLAPPVTPVATVTDTTFTDTNLPPLVRQFYVVTAANDDGESPLGLLAIQLEVRVAAPPDAAVFGFADLHTHQFSNLGFGGKVVFGQAFNSGGVSAALPVCESVHGFAGLSDIVGSATNESIGHHTVPEDPGNANPDGNFRYDAGLPGYIYNLKTTGLAGGTWELRFRVAGDPTEHGAGFQIR